MSIYGHAHACGTYHSRGRIIKYLDLHGIDMVVIMKKKLKLILLTMVSVVLLTKKMLNFG